MNSWRLVSTLTSTVLALCSATAAFAQAPYPDRPVKVIVALPRAAVPT